jgi:UDP-2-acetamido-2-deoxy-ribo-hexuluronate aminotransferase
MCPYGAINGNCGGERDCSSLRTTPRRSVRIISYPNGRRKKAGALGHIGCTSFFPSKNLGCYGDGGAIFTDDRELASRMRVIVNHGMEVRYYHDSVGVNSRLDSIQAAILRVKLRAIWTRMRRHAGRLPTVYDQAFLGHPGITTPARSEFSTHVFHQYTLKTKGIDRFKLQEFLNQREVPAMVYYPVPMHMQKAYRDARYR